MEEKDITAYQVSEFSDSIRKAVSAHHALVVVSFEEGDGVQKTMMVPSFRDEIPSREEMTFISASLINLAASAYMKSPYEVVIRVRDTKRIIEIEASAVNEIDTI
jgi:hypothetical protein